jgi:hypothetical protein
VPPSKKVTVPVGVPDPGGTGATVALKTTLVPMMLGFCDEKIVVVVAVCACAAPNDTSRVAHANATAPITRRRFRSVRVIGTTILRSARANAPRLTCQLVFT